MCTTLRANIMQLLTWKFDHVHIMGLKVLFLGRATTNSDSPLIHLCFDQIVVRCKQPRTFVVFKGQKGLLLLPIHNDLVN